LESYKGLITRSKRKQQFLEIGESSNIEKEKDLTIGDRQEKNENDENRQERKRVPQRRVRNIPLNLQGEQHQFPTLPQGAFPTFLGDGVMDPKKHMDTFLSM